MSLHDAMVPATRKIFRSIGEKGVYVSGVISKSDHFILRRNVQVTGEVGQVVATRDELSIMTETVLKPERGAVVTFDDDGASFKLVSKVQADRYFSKWVVASDG